MFDLDLPLQTGAGEKETLFWKNYFFHCAYTRYQQGLSVEEIWSSKPKAIITGNNEVNTSSTNIHQANEPTLNDIIADEDDETVELDLDEEVDNVLEEDNDDANQSQHSIPNATSAASEVDVQNGEMPDPKEKQSTRSDSVSEFEIVNEAIANIDNSDDLDDLDDLEAEIARELGED